LFSFYEEEALQSAAISKRIANSDWGDSMRTFVCLAKTVTGIILAENQEAARLLFINARPDMQVENFKVEELQSENENGIIVEALKGAFVTYFEKYRNCNSLSGLKDVVAGSFLNDSAPNCDRGVGVDYLEEIGEILPRGELIEIEEDWKDYWEDWPETW
jgi:hypothetical protein